MAFIAASGDTRIADNISGQCSCLHEAHDCADAVPMKDGTLPEADVQVQRRATISLRALRVLRGPAFPHVSRCPLVSSITAVSRLKSDVVRTPRTRRITRRRLRSLPVSPRTFVRPSRQARSARIRLSIIGHIAPSRDREHVLASCRDFPCQSSDGPTDATRPDTRCLLRREEVARIAGCATARVRGAVRRSKALLRRLRRVSKGE